MLQHHPDRSLPDLRRIPNRCLPLFHRSILKSWSLRDSRRGSFCLPHMIGPVVGAAVGFWLRIPPCSVTVPAHARFHAPFQLRRKTRCLTGVGQMKEPVRPRSPACHRFRSRRRWLSCCYRACSAQSRWSVWLRLSRTAPRSPVRIGTRLLSVSAIFFVSCPEDIRRERPLRSPFSPLGGVAYARCCARPLLQAVGGRLLERCPPETSAR